MGVVDQCVSREGRGELLLGRWDDTMPRGPGGGGATWCGGGGGGGYYWDDRSPALS